MTWRGHTTTMRTRDAEDMRRGRHAMTAHRNDTNDDDDGWSACKHERPPTTLTLEWRQDHTVHKNPRGCTTTTTTQKWRDKGTPPPTNNTTSPQHHARRTRAPNQMTTRAPHHQARTAMRALHHHAPMVNEAPHHH